MEPVEPILKNIYQIIPTEKTYAGHISIMSKASREGASEGPTALFIRFCSLSNNSK